MFSLTGRSSFFASATIHRGQDQSYEGLHENLVFDSGGSDLHSRFRGGQAELQNERQKLPDE